MGDEQQKRLKITLVKDWDTGIQPPIGKPKMKGHFAGRKDEVAKLTNDLLNREEGAILVSGYRGVGKTSFVYKCLSSSLANEKGILIVLLNAAQLQDDGGNVVKNLIRRLYSSIKSVDTIKKQTKEDLETLYRKGVSREFSLQEVFQKQAEMSVSSNTERGIDINVSERDWRTIVLITSWSLAMILQLFPATDWSWFNKIVPLLLALPIPFGFSLWYKKKKVEEEKKSLVGSAKELYQFDNSAGNLESDLRDLHEQLYSGGHKIIYVIDELDKLANAQAALDIFTKLKNLFTLSKALFIFVGDEELYNKASVKTSSQTSFRPKEYTYFTHKYFIGRPSWGDLSDYIDEVVQEKNMDESRYNDLKHALLLDSQNDFFDLIERIRDRITSYESGHPLIELDVLSDQDVKKARLHKAVVSVFEEKYKTEMISKWQENELIIRGLLAHANEVLSKQVGSEIQDSQSDALPDAAKRDLNGLLLRMGTFTAVQENHANVSGKSIQVNKYKYEGVVPRDPPEHLPDPSELERKFLRSFETYSDFIVSVINSFHIPMGKPTLSRHELLTNPASYIEELKSPQTDVSNPFNTGREIYLNLTTNVPPIVYKRDQIEQATANLNAQTKNLTSNMRITFLHMIKEMNLRADLQEQVLASNNNLFTGQAQEIRTTLGNVPHVAFFKRDYSKQLLLVDKTQDTNSRIQQIQSIIANNVDQFVILGIGPGPGPIDDMLNVSTDSPDELQKTAVNAVGQLKEFFEL
ncbi:MAG: ATP-binding protein [Thaumarchaeota archaeon]|nr:ATP-binding protein [Nitrososphaerota archaeon]